MIHSLIPEFPACREVALSDKPAFDAALSCMQPEISAYTFTNVFAWRDAHKLGLSRLMDALLVTYREHDPAECLEPIGTSDPLAVMGEAMRLDPDLRFAYLHRRVAEQFFGSPAFHVELDRDNSDYVYPASDLIDLPGRKFDAKRNFINRLKSETPYDYIELCPENVMGCHGFAEEWCEERVCGKDEGLSRERCAVYQMLLHFGELGIVGGAIAVRDKVVAFSLGEDLNPWTLLVHVEKADSKIRGIYQLINNEFCIHEATDSALVNREQDLGIEGIRKAKLSYQPTQIVETYRLRRV
jgi:uncharacterized protein